MASADPADKRAEGATPKPPATSLTGKPGSQAKGIGPQKKPSLKPPAAEKSPGRKRTPAPGRGPAGGRAGDQRGGSRGGRTGSLGPAALGGTGRSSPAKSGPGATQVGAPGSGVAVDLHRVQPGDTFSSLAVAYFGSPRHTQFLIDSNPQIADPNLLRVGSSIKIPALPTRQGSKSATRQPPRSPKGPAGRTAPDRKRETARTYTVRVGDTFYGIARDKLGSASRWQQLLELNKELVNGDPRRLQVGQVLKLPES